MHGMLYNGHMKTAQCEDKTCTPYIAPTSSAFPGLCQLLYVPALLASSRRNSQTALELEPKWVHTAQEHMIQGSRPKTTDKPN